MKNGTTIQKQICGVEMNDLLDQMKNDSKGMGHNSMGKIGAVANDVADTDKEIQDLEDKLKVKKDYKKHLSENVLPNLFAVLLFFFFIIDINKAA